MGNFNKFNKGSGGGRSFGGRPKFGGGGRFGDSDSAPRQMHDATCSKCGQNCQVPFKPNGSRPIFCSNCFKNEGAPTPSRFAPKSFNNFSKPQSSIGSSVSNSGGNNSGITRDQFDTLISKLDKIINLMSGDKHSNIEVPAEDDFEGLSLGQKVTKKTVKNAEKNKESGKKSKSKG